MNRVTASWSRDALRNYAERGAMTPAQFCTPEAAAGRDALQQLAELEAAWDAATPRARERFEHEIDVGVRTQ